MAVCTAGNRPAIWPQVDVASERPARGCWRTLETLSWYSSESSAYVIQGVSVTVRGQAKLFNEGEPQGEQR